MGLRTTHPSTITIRLRSIRMRLIAPQIFKFQVSMRLLPLAPLHATVPMYLHPGQYVHPAASTSHLCSSELSLLPAIGSFLFCLSDCTIVNPCSSESAKPSISSQKKERRYHTQGRGITREGITRPEFLWQRPYPTNADTLDPKRSLFTTNVKAVAAAHGARVCAISLIRISRGRKCVLA